MNDNETVKAFIDYCNSVVDGYFDHLSHGGKGYEHEERHIYMIFGIRNIISHQKAKIEALQMDNAQLHSDIVNANMNLEHLQAEIEKEREAFR